MFVEAYTFGSVVASQLHHAVRSFYPEAVDTHRLGGPLSVYHLFNSSSEAIRKYK